MFRKNVKKLSEYLNEATLSYINQANGNGNKLLIFLNEDLGKLNLYKTKGIKRAKDFFAQHQDADSVKLGELLCEKDGLLSESSDYKSYVLYALIAYTYQCSIDVLKRAVQLCAQSRQTISTSVDHHVVMTDIGTLKTMLLDGWLQGYKEDRDSLRYYVEIEHNMNFIADRLNCSYNELNAAIYYCEMAQQGGAGKKFKQTLLRDCLADNGCALGQIQAGLEANRESQHMEMGVLGKLSGLFKG